MRVTRKHILLLLFLLPACLKGFSQQGQLQFTHLDVNDGLSHNQVNCILKDNKGFLWFGTMSGLDRYDGYSFKVFRHDVKDTTSLSDDYIKSIFKLPDNKLWVNTRNGSDVYNPLTETFDRNSGAYLRSLHLPGQDVSKIVEGKDGNYWFIFSGLGLFRFDTHSKNTIHVGTQAGNNSSIADDNIADAGFDSAGNLWIIHNNGKLEELNPHDLRIIYRSDTLFNLIKADSQQYDLYIDRQNDLWIYATGTGSGVYYFNPLSHQLLHFTKESSRNRLNNDVVYGITQDEKGIIWIGTDHGGINLINKKDFSVGYLMHNPEDPGSLAQNSVYALYKDNAGIIWVGTYKKGISYYNEIFDRFPLYSHDPNNIHSLPYSDVNRFLEDKSGNLWIGTNGGGLIYFDRKNNTYKQYLHQKHNANSLCNNVIVGLYLDKNNKLWIGTYMGGLDHFDGKTFTHYHHINGDTTSLSNNSVWDIFEDTNNNLWIATLGGGLERFDERTKKFIHVLGKADGSTQLSYVSVVTEDKSGNLWIGTAGGVEVMNLLTGKVTNYNYIPNDPNSLSNDNVNTIYQDSRGWIWIGTREGLNYFDPVTKEFHALYIKDGLPDNTILTILEDEQHHLWLGTPNGLSRLTMTENRQQYKFFFTNYDESDGLQGREFNDKSAFKTREGSLIFGGANGFNLFNPSLITVNKNAAPIVFTDLQIFNKSISIGEKIRRHVILTESITETKSFTLPYGANDFSIVFAALGYNHPDKSISAGGQSRYGYKLEGFNTNWIYTNGNAHKATYTNLDPGKYTFRVRASNNDGIWGSQEASIQVIVLPPFWKTIWAYILYVMVIIGILYMARRLLLYRARMNFQMEHQQREAERMHELDMMKIRFFTNISHEFRTPLTLILTPLERMMNQVEEGNLKKQLQLIQRNAKRLLHLVNQLLDFRKLEVQEVRLNPAEKDIIKFIKEIVYSFSDIAEKKNIHFTLETTLEMLLMRFDSDKMERIFFNLLSNAFKFTPEYGSITVSLDVEKPQVENRHDLTFFRIRVEDTGIGIPSEKQGKIFERFFQHDPPPSLVNPGSGIGLAITKEFVRLHHGTIGVESEPGKGSCFTILLPVEAGPSGIMVQDEVKKVTSIPLIAQMKTAPDLKTSRKRYTILLVEDNEDFRFYLKDNLSLYFNMLEAPDGKKGWEEVLSHKPDLIVSDILMPVMDGIELSKRLKNDPRTALIPVILLTARGSEEQRLEGYKTGANDYMVKPFNFEILLARIRNLLAERKQHQKKDVPKVEIGSTGSGIHSFDEKFLEDASAIVEKNISNPDFSVEELSRLLYVSRVTLYKKIVSVTGKTPVEYIRIIRLKQAAGLLQKGMNVSQAAYETGFNNPKYFTKYFKEEFGMLPSEFAKQKKNKEGISD